MTSFSDRYRNSQHIRRQASEDDFTDPAFVTGAVLAQIEDLDRDDKIAVLEGILTNTPNTSDAVATYDFGDPDYVALAVQAQLEDLPLSEQHAVIRDVLSQVRKGAKTAYTLTEWSVSVTSPNRWMSTPGVWDGHPNAILNVHKTVDEPNEFGGIGKSVKHPEYDGLTFDSVDEAWAFAESKGLVSKRGSKTAAGQRFRVTKPGAGLYVKFFQGGGMSERFVPLSVGDVITRVGDEYSGGHDGINEAAFEFNGETGTFSRSSWGSPNMDYLEPVTGSRKTATDPYGIWATTPGATGIAPGFEGKTYKPYKYTPDNTTQPGRNWAVIVELPDGDIDFMADGLSAEEAYEDAKRWNANPFLAPDHSQFHDDTMFGLIQGGRVAKDVQWSANQPPSDRVYLIDTNVEPIPYRPGGGDAAASFLWPRAEAERAIGEHRPDWRYPAREIADPKDGWYVSWGPSVHAGGDNYWNLNNRNFARREARHREVARRKRANEIMGYEDEKELEADEPENMVPVAASVPAQGRVSDWRRTAELTAEDCIDSADGTCSGEVEYRMPLSSSGKSFPRCHRHWLKRLDREQDNPYPDSPIAPSWFDPAAAGERWDDDY